jgi:hypothetical protein
MATRSNQWQQKDTNQQIKATNSSHIQLTAAKRNKSNQRWTTTTNNN